jgi:hypothetical protein
MRFWPKVNVMSMPPPKAPPRKKKRRPKTWKDIVYGLLKSRMFYAALVVLVGLLAYYGPGWWRKMEFYGALGNGKANYLCLGHAMAIFEERQAQHSMATRQNYIRFNKQIFMKDYLEDPGRKIGYIGVIADAENKVFWTELSEKESLQIMRDYGLVYGTCIASEMHRFAMPGAYKVTQ